MPHLGDEASEKPLERPVGWPPINMSSPTLTNFAWNIADVSRFTGFIMSHFIL